MALTFYVIKGQRMASRRLPLSLGDPSDTDRPFSRLRRSSKKEQNFLWIQQCMCRSCLFTQLYRGIHIMLTHGCSLQLTTKVKIQDTCSGKMY